ncbi:MAG: hypothetical protein HYY65_13255 [Candidatus Tectomicrobia bacterium]|uniref:TRASH domain-containing protein n=1 Tax=Tectimicrobiota bacterium TaxID=2528274 RepID=A0A932GSD0_UNCTE|nr:hypothetical protein [Candidatus Tectomicrobia bacterium]
MRFFLFFFLAILAYYGIWLLYRILRFWFSWKKRIAAVQGPQADELVLDPACQVYIPKGTALRRRIRGDQHYFCSEECVRTYKRQGKNQKD